MEKLKFGDDMKKMGDILPSILRKMGIKKGIEQGKAIAFWEDIVGDDIARHARPFRAKKGILYVAVTSSVWANELQFMEPEIRKKINEYLKKDVIYKIRFYPSRYNKLFKKNDKEKIKENSRTRKLSGKPKKDIDKISSQILDKNLRERFKKAMKLHKKRE